MRGCPNSDQSGSRGAIFAVYTRPSAQGIRSCRLALGPGRKTAANGGVYSPHRPRRKPPYARGCGTVKTLRENRRTGKTAAAIHPWKPGSRAPYCDRGFSPYTLPGPVYYTAKRRLKTTCPWGLPVALQSAARTICTPQQRTNQEPWHQSYNPRYHRAIYTHTCPARSEQGEGREVSNARRSRWRHKGCPACSGTGRRVPVAAMRIHP